MSRLLDVAAGARVADESNVRATRRRGRVLEEAIFSAVLEELVDVGYAHLALDRVAQRARISRASLYRRWPGKRELVADAVADALPVLGEPPDTGDVREDLLICFDNMYGLLAGVGRFALQAVASELPEAGGNGLVTLVREQVLEPRLQVILSVLQRGAARGQLRTENLVPIIARTGPALLFQHLIMFGTPPPPTLIAEIVDRVILPAAGATPTADPQRKRRP
jgi:AcrR family transcriptional regulator